MLKANVCLTAVANPEVRWRQTSWLFFSTLLRETFTAKPRRHDRQTHARRYVIRSTRSQPVRDKAKCTGCPRLPSISTTNETKTKINEWIKWTRCSDCAFQTRNSLNVRWNVIWTREHIGLNGYVNLPELHNSALIFYTSICLTRLSHVRSVSVFRGRGTVGGPW